MLESVTCDCTGIIDTSHNRGSTVNTTISQRDMHNQNVYIVNMCTGDGLWLSKHSERKRLIVRRSHRITAGLWGN